MILQKLFFLNRSYKRTNTSIEKLFFFLENLFEKHLLMMFVCVYAGTAFSFNLELKTGETARYSTPTLTHNNITGLRSPLSFFCVYTHARTHTYTDTVSLSPAHSHRYTQTNTRCLFHTHTHGHCLSFTLSLALTHIHIQTYTHTTHRHSHTHSLSLTHTHANTCTHTLSLFHTHTQKLVHAMSLFHSLSPLTRTNTTFLFFIPSLFLVFHF